MRERERETYNENLFEMQKDSVRTVLATMTREVPRTETLEAVQTDTKPFIRSDSGMTIHAFLLVHFRGHIDSPQSSRHDFRKQDNATTRQRDNKNTKKLGKKNDKFLSQPIKAPDSLVAEFSEIGLDLAHPITL